jgi:hypothetical protein
MNALAFQSDVNHEIHTFEKKLICKVQITTLLIASHYNIQHGNNIQH